SQRTERECRRDPGRAGQRRFHQRLDAAEYQFREKERHAHFLFKSDPDEKSLKLPGDFPKGAPRIKETGALQDVTANLFPKYAAAGRAAPSTVQIQPDVKRDGVTLAPPPLTVATVPEPASVALLGTGIVTLGGFLQWRRRNGGGGAEK